VSIDFDAIKARLSAVQAAEISVIHTRLVDHGIRVWVSMRDWNGNNRYDADAAVTNMFGNAVVDIGALVEEVERLRSINDDYLLEMGRQHALLRDQAREAKTERAAVVAWLQRMAGNARHWAGDDNIRAEIYDNLVDVFECGEHREGEK